MSGFLFHLYLLILKDIILLLIKSIEKRLKMRLQGKVAIVTASTRGIGFAIVKSFLNEGAKVYMAVRNIQRANDSIAQFPKEWQERVFPVFCDASKEESFSSSVEEVGKKEGHIDILVNNFGTSDPTKDRDLRNTDPKVFIDTISINLKSVFMTSQAALKYMDKNGGSIINISSIGGKVPDLSQVAYGTSKAAINYLTQLISVTEARNNIRCNAVLPGITATDAVKQNINEAFQGMFLKHVPLNRMALPEEIADAVLFFASDESKYITGQVLAVAGGFDIATPLYGDFIGKDRSK